MPRSFEKFSCLNRLATWQSILTLKENGNYFIFKQYFMCAAYCVGTPFQSLICSSVCLSKNNSVRSTLHNFNPIRSYKYLKKGCKYLAFCNTTILLSRWQWASKFPQAFSKYVFVELQLQVSYIFVYIIQTVGSQTRVPTVDYIIALHVFLFNNDEILG